MSVKSPFYKPFGSTNPGFSYNEKSNFSYNASNPTDNSSFAGHLPKRMHRNFHTNWADILLLSLALWLRPSQPRWTMAKKTRSALSTLTSSPTAVLAIGDAFSFEYAKVYSSKSTRLKILQLNITQIF
jgi:hypothetical protein